MLFSVWLLLCNNNVYTCNCRKGAHAVMSVIKTILFYVAFIYMLSIRSNVCTTYLSNVKYKVLHYVKHPKKCNSTAHCFLYSNKPFIVTCL